MYLSETVGPRRKARRVNICYELVEHPVGSLVPVATIRESLRKKMSLPALIGESKLGDIRATGDALSELGIERVERYGKMSVKITHRVLALAHMVLDKHLNPKAQAA